MADPSKQHGGRRLGAGRKPSADGKVLITSGVALYQEMWDYAEKIGEGNFSVGIRKIISDRMATAAPVLQSTAKRTTPPYVATMKKLGLTYDGYDWYRDDARLSIGAVRKLKQEYPELAQAE